MPTQASESLATQLDRRRAATLRVAPIDDDDAGRVDPWVRPARRWIRVRIARDYATVNGPGTGQLIRAAGGKVMWSRSVGAYMTTPKRAADVLALAEHSGYAAVVVEGEAS